MGDWHIEVWPDYGCHPVWTHRGNGSRQNTDPADLQVEPVLARDLHAWAGEFDATLDQEYPPDSGFADPQTEDAFWARGMLLACRLAIELAGRHTVSYWDGRLSCLVQLLSADGGVKVDRARLRLPDHWIDLDPEPTSRRSLTEQLHRELPTDHVLTEAQWHMLAQCTNCDDVLLTLDDHRYAIVHLTWQRRPGNFPDWPSTRLHSDPVTLLADLADCHVAL